MAPEDNQAVVRRYFEEAPDPGSPDVIADGSFLIFDVGSGSALRAELEGLPLPNLETVFLTHLHSDHMADVPLMANISWRAGRRRNLRVTAPRARRP